MTYTYCDPTNLMKDLIASGSPTIAYTYTEPTIFYEYMLESAAKAHELGFKNVMHSCGYINEAPLRRLAKYLDAANIDVKGFDDGFYRRTFSASLYPVLKTLLILKEEGVHIEVTNLLLPGINDSEEMIRALSVWIKDNLGEDTPLHFSRFFPMYKLIHLNPTPVSTLEKARQIALTSGLRYVYIGNVPAHPAEQTYCQNCGKILIERKGYFVVQNNIKDGRCAFCGEEIKGIWK